MIQQQQQQQQGNKNQLHGNVNQLGMGPLGSKSPNLQSPPQSSLPNTMGMNSMPMSIANNGTQPMSSMQAMRGQGTGVGGGMIMTNSNMGSMGNVGMGGGGLVVNSLKQPMASGGGMIMNPNSMQQNSQQGMHHPMHPNSMQNGPMGAGVRMNMQQQHMGGMQRMPNQHMMNQRLLSQPQQVNFLIDRNRHYETKNSQIHLCLHNYDQLTFASILISATATDSYECWWRWPWW